MKIFYFVCESYDFIKFDGADTDHDVGGID